LKRRLFWKILFAFWLTIFAITQGVWLTFEARQNDDSFGPMGGGPPEMAAAAAVLQHGGVAGFEAFQAQLPAMMRNSLTREPVAQRERDPADTDRTSRIVIDPEGNAHRLSLSLDMPNRPFRFLNIPPDVVIIGMLCGLLFSALLARYLTDPINRLRVGFEMLAAGKLDTRVARQIGNRNDEIADLGRDFDRMATRLEDLVAARVRLLHDVSHEFRSPLARMHLALALMRQSRVNTDSSVARMTLEIERLDHLVDELLTLTRLEHEGLPEGDEYFDLVDIVQSVVDDARFETGSEATEVHLANRIEAGEDERAPTKGQARLIRRALDNVLRNAIRFSPPGEAVDVMVGLSCAEQRYFVEIADKGPGVAPETLSTIFDPFVRAQTHGEGHGLGLAIARRAVLVHGGSIAARNRAGGGFAVRIELPIEVAG
jgi:two-component system OmpR family sensor kinase